jgi:hypothetical protein
MNIIDMVVDVIRNRGGRGDVDDVLAVLSAKGVTKNQISKAMERGRVSKRLASEGPRRQYGEGKKSSLPSIHRLGPRELSRANVFIRPTQKPPSSIFELGQPRELLEFWPLQVGEARFVRPLGGWHSEEEGVTA